LKKKGKIASIVFGQPFNARIVKMMF